MRGRGKYPPTGNRVSFAGMPAMLKVVAWRGLREYALLPSEFPRIVFSGSLVSRPCLLLLFLSRWCCVAGRTLTQHSLGRSFDSSFRALQNLLKGGANFLEPLL